MLDPLLLLDHFQSENVEDRGAGLAPHPHRGFETVTYMLEGRMHHRDSLGSEGVVDSGGVQWMTAGRGIVHSETPEPQDGKIKGFQLWINLPASHKMAAPKYQEFDTGQIPTEETTEGGTVRVIAGETNNGLKGPVLNTLTDPLYLDITLMPDESFKQAVPESHNVAIFGISGKALAKDIEVQPEQLGIFSDGTDVEITAGPDGGRLLLIAGQVLNEPVARGGPFVMNSEAEVRQAFADYRAGAL